MIEKDRSTVHDVFYVHYVAQRVVVYNLMETLTQVQEIMHVLLHVISYLLTHEVTVYDIFC